LGHHVHPTHRRARDRDNLLAASKPMLDGVVDALGINDSQFEPVTIRREYGKKPGGVRIEISQDS
jgi:crossover junction endodeoxyribonuclease RusA